MATESDAAVKSTKRSAPATASKFVAQSDPPGAMHLPKKESLVWQHGLDLIRESHGAALSEEAVQFVRRILNELWCSSVGGPPPSTLAQEAAGKLGDADWLNSQGQEQSAGEFAALNQQGK